MNHRKTQGEFGAKLLFRFYDFTKAIIDVNSTLDRVIKPIMLTSMATFTMNLKLIGKYYYIIYVKVHDGLE